VRPVAIDLIARLVAAMLAVGVAAAVVVSVAALADGHLPRLDTLRATALPVAAFIGGAWTVAAWRAEGADLALANTGRSPLLAVLGLALLAGLALAAGTERAGSAPPNWDLELHPDRLVVHHPGARDVYTWHDTTVTRAADGERFEGWPAPGTTAVTRPTDRTPVLLATRCTLLLVLLGWLGRRSQPPGLALSFAASGGAFAASWLAATAIA
jgi:hypothetical protein